MNQKLMTLNWVWLVLLGAPLNVIINFGYKVIGVDVPVLWVLAGVFGTASIILFVYSLFKQRDRLMSAATGKRPVALLVMGTLAAISAICFVTALTIGPISLIDPLWVCIYSIMSLLIGFVILRERPSVTAVCGIALYLIGAMMMVQG